MSAAAALHFAAENCNVGVIELLVAHGIGIEVQSKDGDTPLMTAASAGHPEAIATLLRLGADLHRQRNVRKTGRDRSTALFWAVFNGHAKAVACLLEAKSDLHHVDKDGDTPLLYAGGRDTTDEDEDMVMEAREFAEIARLLLAAGADVHHANKKGATALVLAARNCRAEVLPVLIEAKAEVNHTTKNGMTALAMAAKKGHDEVVEALLAAGADPKISGPRFPALACLPLRTTPLVIARLGRTSLPRRRPRQRGRGGATVAAHEEVEAAAGGGAGAGSSAAHAAAGEL